MTCSPYRSEISSLLYILCIAGVLIFPINASSQSILDLGDTPQEHSEWCWAAIVQSILSQSAPIDAQCEIVEWARERNPELLGTDNCCEIDPKFRSESPCNHSNWTGNHPGSVQDILQNHGVDNSPRLGALSFDEIAHEIENGRPFIVRWEMHGGSGHFVVGHGYDDDVDQTVYYWNPWPGEGFKITTYKWIKESVSNHRWTHSNTITDIISYHTDSTDEWDASVPIDNWDTNNGHGDTAPYSDERIDSGEPTTDAGADTSSDLDADNISDNKNNSFTRDTDNDVSTYNDVDTSNMIIQYYDTENTAETKPDDDTDSSSDTDSDTPHESDTVTTEDSSNISNTDNPYDDAYEANNAKEYDTEKPKHKKDALHPSNETDSEFFTSNDTSEDTNTSTLEIKAGPHDETIPPDTTSDIVDAGVNVTHFRPTGTNSVSQCNCTFVGGNHQRIQWLILAGFVFGIH